MDEAREPCVHHVRVEISAPNLRLTARMRLILAIAVQELATKAATPDTKRAIKKFARDLGQEK